MALLYTKVFIYTLVCIAVAGLTDHLNSESFKSFESIFDFTVGLKNESDNILDYATKIQALFCPEQPICTAEGDRNSADVLDTLPEMIGIGTEVIQMEEVHKIIGACCLPCSCDTRTCKQNGNCCLSKIFADALENNSEMDDQNMLGVLDRLNDVSEFKDKNSTRRYSECIKASWLSYRDKDEFTLASDHDLPAYFMITRCFENNAIQEDVTKCQTPSDDNDDDEVMLPVISSDTGQIYWNSYCARCNDDERDILPWTASVKFGTDIAYFVNNSDPSLTVYPDTYDGIPEFLSKTGNIVYTPPVPQGDKLCLRKNTLLTCKGKTPKRPWLEMACERIYSPLIIENFLERRYGFLNIFCYLCSQQYIKPSASRQCTYAGGHTKITFEGMSALLDFTGLDSSNNVMTIAQRQDKCRCDEIYDHHLVSILIMFFLK